MQPLSGVRVIDLTSVVAGPLCTMMLGDMGAEILKIEDPAGGDDTRSWTPRIGGVSSFFLSVNRSKKSVTVDLKSPAGLEMLRALITTADVFVENKRPGSLARLGLGYDDAARLNARMVYCSISGYGQTGPSADRSGYDVVIQGETGLMDMTGAADGEPMRTGVAITDYLAGVYASQGILLALYERMTSGLGQHVDVALFDAMFSAMRLPISYFAATGSEPTRVGNGHLSLAPYEPLRARDGFLIVAIGNERLWSRLCRALDRPDLAVDGRFATNASRVRRRAELTSTLESILAQWTVDELGRRLDEQAIPWGRVRTVRQAVEHPQVLARGLLLEHSDPLIGRFTTVAPVVRLSRTPATPSANPPRLGEHTDEYLGAGAAASRSRSGLEACS